MSILQQDYKYYRVAEIPQVPPCVISTLNHHYNNDFFKHLPNLPNLIINSYSSDLYGDIQEFEIRYRRVRRQINSIVYSIAIRQGGDLFQKFYDYSVDACLETFLELRLRDINEYEEFIERVFKGDVSTRDFKVLFKNYRKP